MAGYRIDVVTQNEAEKVVDFLRKFFFRDEPLNRETRLIDNKSGTCNGLENYCLDVIFKGYSLKAVSNVDDRIIGVSLLDIVYKDANLNDCDIEDRGCEDPKFASIIKLLKTIDEKIDIFGQYSHIDAYLEVKILSVDSDYRGQGVGKALVQYSRQIAAKNNVKMVRADCTSHFSARLFESLGFKCIYTLPYNEYCYNDIPVFNPEPPHKQAKVVVQEIY